MSRARFMLRMSCWSVAALLVLGCACVAADFSADMVMSAGKQQVTGKMRVSGNNVRQEMSMGNMKQVTILRTDKSVVWIINPNKKEYSEMRDARIAGQNPRSDARMGTKKVLRKEKIGGFTCDKAQYTSKEAPGAKIIRWYSKDLDWPVKTEMSRGPGESRSEELKNVKIGKQPASLFELPKGYKKVPMQMPGMPAGRGGTKKPGAPRK